MKTKELPKMLLALRGVNEKSAYAVYDNTQTLGVRVVKGLANRLTVTLRVCR